MALSKGAFESGAVSLLDTRDFLGVSNFNFVRDFEVCSMNILSVFVVDKASESNRGRNKKCEDGISSCF